MPTTNSDSHRFGNICHVEAVIRATDDFSRGLIRAERRFERFEQKFDSDGSGTTLIQENRGTAEWGQQLSNRERRQFGLIRRLVQICALALSKLIRGTGQGATVQSKTSLSKSQQSRQAPAGWQLNTRPNRQPGNPRHLTNQTSANLHLPAITASEKQPVSRSQPENTTELPALNTAWTREYGRSLGV